MKIRLTPEIQDGFMSMVDFRINDKEEMKVVIHKEIPNKFIIECIEQWIKQQKEKNYKK